MATNVDKEKALHFIEALQPHAGTTITREELDSTAKVIKDFGKASVSEGKSTDEAKFSLRSYSKFQKEMEQWLRRNRLPEHAQRPTPPQRMPNETTAQFAARVNKFLAEDALWQTAPVYRGHLFADGTAMGEYNRELQRRSVLARITLQDSMLPVRKAQEAIAKEHGLHRMGIFEDVYLAETRSHGMAKNQMEQFNTFFLEPLRKAYHELSRKLGGYDKVKVYMMAKHGLERNRVIAFRDAQYNAWYERPKQLRF